MADDSITFMFYTRTLSEDYRVFAGDGSKLGDYAEFEQFMRIARVERDDEACTVVYESIGRWYLAVFGLNRKSKDRAGREKRFSFCVSFNGTSIKERGRAIRAFSCVVNNWDRIGKLADSLLKETHTMREYDVVVDIHDKETGATKRVRKHKTVPGEYVKFDYEGFIHELVRPHPTIKPPETGKILKYFADTRKFDEISPEDDSGEGYTRRLVIGLLLAGVIVVGWLMWYFMSDKKPSKPPDLPSKSQDAQSSQPGNSSETSADITSNNKEARKSEHNQTGGNGIMSGDNESHRNDSTLDIQGNNGGAISPGSGNNAAPQGDNGNTKPAGQTQTGNR